MMNREGILFILNSVGCEKIRESHDNILASCPFARFGGHKSQLDKHPSFSIKISESGESPWVCFACGRSGTIRGLLYQLGKCGYEVQSLRNFVDRNQTKGIDTSIDKMGYSLRNPSVRKKIEPQRALANGWFEFADQEESRSKKILIDDFKNELCIPMYAIKRGCTPQQCLKWNLGIMKKWDKDKLFIPVFNLDREMVGYSLRALNQEDKPKYLHMEGFKRDKVLFGEQFIDNKSRRAYVVEGFFDVFALDRLGLKNSLAVMGTHVSSEQLKRLLGFDEIVIFPHNDHSTQETTPPGLAMAHRLVQSLRAYKPRIDVRLAPFCEGVKDVGDASEEQIRWMLQQVAGGKDEYDTERRETETQ